MGDGGRGGMGRGVGGSRIGTAVTFRSHAGLASTVHMDLNPIIVSSFLRFVVDLSFRG